MICPVCNKDMQDGGMTCKHCGAMLDRHRNEMAQGHHEHRMPTMEGPQHPSFTHFFFAHTGRINRAKYWLGNLLLSVICGISSAIFESIHPGLGFFAVLGMTYPSVILSIKRAHDLDRSGHFCWLLLIPLVSLVPGIMLSFFKGTPGPNRFGPDPLSPSPKANPEVPFPQAV
jgi:uncharacterized membrane protein YhaH (DUF805 family)